MLFVILLAVFVGTVSLCVGGYMFVHRRQYAAAEVARARLGGDAADTPRAPAANILRDTSASELELLDRLLSGKATTARLTRALQRAGSAAKPGTFVLALGIGGVSGALVGSVLGSLALPLAAVGLVIPVFWLKQRQRRRLAAFQEQLPEALDMLVSAMRAGYSFQTAMKFVGEEMPAPLGAEFLQFYDEQRLGVEVRAALVALQDRSASADMKMFVTAVLIHRDTGGNLSEVLSNIADVMRQRADVHRQVDTLTAQSKLSARILAVLPLMVFGAVISMDREFIRPMLEEPTGRFMLAYAAVSVILGYVILMRIAKVDV
ncbi:MAG: type II secretion system F family protein [Gemmatimonadota bacterium]|nr:type II secretion system F family protein [Gemmatimonadota bacterium]